MQARVQAVRHAANFGQGGARAFDGLGVYYEIHGGPLSGRTPMVLVACLAHLRPTG